MCVIFKGERHVCTTEMANFHCSVMLQGESHNSVMIRFHMSYCTHPSNTLLDVLLGWATLLYTSEYEHLDVLLEWAASSLQPLLHAELHAFPYSSRLQINGLRQDGPNEVYPSR